MVDPKRRNLRLSVIGAVSGAFVSGGAAAHAAEPTTRELMEQIKALQAKIERLESSQNVQERQSRARDVDATVDSVLRDADRRSQLLAAGGFTAGWSKNKFIIQSEDGNFVLNPNFQFQLRYVYNYREEDAGDEIAGDATNESGLEVRRMKFAFEGNAFNPNLKYKFQWATSRSNGTPTLEDAFITYKFADAWAIKAGQYKDVTFHEELTSSKRQLAVDRSLLNEAIGGGVTDYIQGVALIWDDGVEGLPVRGEFGYTDGINSDNTNFVDGGGSGAFSIAAPDFGLYGRAEYLAFGDWKQYDDFSAMGNTQDLLVLGAGAHYTEAGDNFAVFHTVDAQWEVGDFGLYAAYVGVYSDLGAGIDTDDDDVADVDDTYDYGFLVQAGYMLTDQWELFGRYDLTSIDEDRLALSDDEFHEFTAGVNYYFKGHAAKLTLDGVYLPDGIPSDQNGIGELDPDADSDQFALRAQFQLLL
jgi:hypothetical protein